MTYKRWQGPDRPVSNGATVARLTLEPNEDAPRAARAAIADLGGQASEDVLERATLLISEVVTNSVVHAGGSEVRVDIWPMAGAVAVVVSDDGPGFAPSAQNGTIAEMGDHNGGFGLPLLDTLSEAWGSGRAADAWVWFEVLPRIVIRPDRAPTQGDEAGHDQLLDVRMLVDSVREHALLALDPAGNVTNWGTVAEEMTGYSAPEFLGRPVFDLFVPPSARAFERDCAAAGTEGWHEVERWLKRKDGTQFWADVALAPIVDRSGTLRGLSALISDATERKQTESERERLIADLRDLAMTDELTGLPNRRRWDDELNRDLARSRRHDTPLAVAMLDLNDFKAFNDTQGHPAGDLILQGVAREWSEAVRATDMLARYGGDEFAITLPDCPPALALTVIGRVQAATPNGIASSAGIASSDGVETADQLVARADAALYDAKRNGESVAVATNA